MKRILLMVTAFILLASTVSARLPVKMVFNTAHYSPRSTPEGNGFEDLLLKEALRRLGVQLKIVNLPSERCLVNVNEGIDDGNFARVEGMEKTYPNLLMVPEPIADFEFVVFSKRSDLKVDGWESLNGYHIGYITGWKIVESKTAKARSRSAAKDYEALFKLLEIGRVDLVVFDRAEGECFVRKRGLNDISTVLPILERRNMYVYLNRRHASMASEMAKVFIEMKKDGTFREIVKKALRK